MKEMPVFNQPVTVQLDITTGKFEPCPDYIERKVSDLAMMFADQQAVQALIAAGDRVVYEIRSYPFVTDSSDMVLGTTTIFPGTVGGEYHLTKGHFHARDDRAEIYFCVQGEGYLIMENRAGEFHAIPWNAGTITHIPPGYAHRVINTGSTPLVFVASFQVSAGHNYGEIEARGFSHVIVERDGNPAIVPNPRRDG